MAKFKISLNIVFCRCGTRGLDFHSHPGKNQLKTGTIKRLASDACSQVINPTPRSH